MKPKLHKSGTLYYLLLLILIGFSMTNCVNDDRIIIRYAHVGVKNEPQTRFAGELAELVNERTNGRVEIQVYPNSQLGNISELVDGVKYGFIGVSQQDFSSLNKFYNDLSVFNVPFLYRDINHALLATNPPTSPILAQMNARLIENSNIRILGSFYRGARQLTTNFPVYSTDDLKGKKIRGVPFPIWMSMIKGMGAIPTPVEFSELSTALMTGLVVGQENPLSNIYASQIHEVQSHIAFTNHMYSCLCVFIHEKLWQRISNEDQQIIFDAIRELSAAAVKWIEDSDEELKKILESEGMVLTDSTNGLDIDNFKQSVHAQINVDFPEWNAYIEEIQKIK